jgi:hypothetical protein
VRLRSRDLFQTAHTEGGLLPADLLQRVADGDRTLPALAPADYHLTPGERLNEAITRSWTRLVGAWRTFDEARNALPPGDPAGRLTRERWLQPLFEELRYGRLVQQPAIEIEGKSFPVFSQWQHTPIHLVGCGVKLDARTPGVKGAAGQSPHSLVQELLNRSPTRLWGIVSNGLGLRVLRDSVALTRQAYLEFDLEAMFTGEVYADFVLLWLVCHQSRVEADKPENCPLEQWTHAATQDGTRALDTLRHGVEDAIQTLGAGFLAHPANHKLHAALRDGTLDGPDYYRQLLRLVYRLLFLFVAEDRDALLDPNGNPLARERYLAHYSTRRLRDLAIKRRGGRQHDRYEQLKLVMAALDTDGCAPLALPALGSYLWSRGATGLLADCKLANDDLLAAIRSLSTIDEGVRRAVDFRNLGSEELGSVYESLLELHPTLDRATATFTLDAVAGSERKTTGSYYTPTSLISSLLDSALERVLDEAACAEDPEAAILSLAVVDPACGSGHFLIAAANRVAKRLAAVRSRDPEPSPNEVRAALRDVVGSCIHGVDLNPMAVELCKVSLWMEALEPGRPLSFLDHRIVLGNALLGTSPELIAAGIPADAFKPILGDDKKTVTELRKRNAKELSGQLAFNLAAGNVDADARVIAAASAEIAAIDDGSLAGVREQQHRFEQLLGSPELRRARLGADVWCAAFIADKRPGATAITQDTLVRALGAGTSSLSDSELEVVARGRTSYGFLHWHVAFPAVSERGGFDVVLGNPPWERVKLQEKEFFAARSPEIATAANKATRDRLIRALADDGDGGDRELLAAFEAAKRAAEGASHFIRHSGRYPLCGRGDVNTYAVFAELMRTAIGSTGRVGIIVPTGIVTDDTTKLFFQDLIDSGSIDRVYDFKNHDRLFYDVGHRRFHFCLLVIVGAAVTVEKALFAFSLHDPADVSDPGRVFALTADDIAALNPNTRTCPVFRSQRDATLTTAIYGRVPVLVRESDGANPWAVTFMAMFHMSGDSHFFETSEGLVEQGYSLTGNTFVRDGHRMLPLYEAKMLHQFDHRYGDYSMRAASSQDTQLPDIPLSQKQQASYVPQPRYWVTESEVLGRLKGRWDLAWLTGWRDICRNTDERTCIAAVSPVAAMGGTWIVAFPQEREMAPLFAACLSTFVVDYVVRQKVGGTHLNHQIMKQVPLPPPSAIERSFYAPRVAELTYTATDLAPFARDLGYDGPAFGWDPERRALIRAELDAAMFRLFGIERDDADYILETFPIVRRHDEKRSGEYSTKRLILERYDAMVTAEAAGVGYATPLDPPPGMQRHGVQV